MAMVSKFRMKVITCLTAIVSASLLCSFIGNDGSESYDLFSEGWHKGIQVVLIGEKNGKSLLVDGASENFPFEGEVCLEVSADNSEYWRGFQLAYSEVGGNAGDSIIDYIDLSNYDKLEFYAKANTKLDAPYAIMEVGVGDGKGYKGKRIQNYIEIGNMWQRYVLDLKGMDLQKVRKPLYMKLSTGTVYLDGIKFIKTTKK